MRHNRRRGRKRACPVNIRRVGGCQAGNRPAKTVSSVGRLASLRRWFAFHVSLVMDVNSEHVMGCRERLCYHAIHALLCLRFPRVSWATLAVLYVRFLRSNRFGSLAAVPIPVPWRPEIGIFSYSDLPQFSRLSAQATCFAAPTLTFSSFMTESDSNLHGLAKMASRADAYKILRIWSPRPLFTAIVGSHFPRLKRLMTPRVLSDPGDSVRFVSIPNERNWP
jgi:hypothetical protein